MPPPTSSPMLLMAMAAADDEEEEEEEGAVEPNGMGEDASGPPVGEACMLRLARPPLPPLVLRAREPNGWALALAVALVAGVDGVLRLRENAPDTRASTLLLPPPALVLPVLVPLESVMDGAEAALPVEDWRLKVLVAAA